MLTRLAERRPSPLQSLLLPLGLTAAATLARCGLSPIVGSEAVFTLYTLAVFFSTVGGAAAAGAVAALLGGGLGLWLFGRPEEGGRLDLADVAALVLFWLVSAFLISALSLLRRALSSAAAATAREHLLAREMAHRTKNVLSLVQSVVSQTHRTTADPGEIRAKLDARLSALGKAQDIALAEDQEVRVTQVIETALSAFPGRRFRLAFDADWEVRPETARLLLLALHELATNATKYGALSTDRGCVDIGLRGGADGLVILTWSESGGPEVRSPTRQGFGMRLIASAFAAPPQKTEIEFGPDGFRCVFTLRGRRAPRASGAPAETPVRA